MSASTVRTTYRDDLPATLDSLLVRAAVRGTTYALPIKQIARWGRSALIHPRRTGRRGWETTRELTAIAAGTSSISPAAHDRRFADRAWRDNGAYRRMVQTYLALGDKAHQVLRDAELSESDYQRLKLIVDNVIDALAPSNGLFNPLGFKEAIDTGGASWARGLRNLVRDVSQAPRVPSMVDDSAFELGKNIAASPGEVVHRTPMYELIQYKPATEQVYEVPLLMVPPTINKYYALDLAPGRSVIEYLVGEGHQVFVMSWRNPTARHADWGIDAYAHSILTAFDTVRSISRTDQASLWGTCSGGILTIAAVANLVANGKGDQLASLALPVTVLDQRIGGPTGALLDPGMAQVAVQRSRRAGYLDGSSLTELFAWLRPNDLIWNYWVSNYLLGKTPPAFDILYWNADSTRMAAQLHADFVDLAVHNRLVEPGSMVALGLPIDLGEIKTDTFVIGAVADHITPWQSCYRTTQLLGGKTEFVLSNSGHIAAMVNPPGNPKASFQHGVHTPADPQEFKASADREQGSWWPRYSAWLAARSGEFRDAPETLGDVEHPALDAAPGRYVLDR